MSVQIAPSLLAADFGKLYDEVDSVEDAGADMLHLDVMDGRFVPNITFGHDVVSALRDRSELVFDVHLMIVEPWQYVDMFAQAGADIITVHAEVCPHLHRTVQMIKETGKRAGVAVNPATPVTVVEHVIDDIDLLLIMSVNPGFGGQKYIEVASDKIAHVVDMRGDREFLCQVDGGINEVTAKLAVNAGVDVLVAGTSVFSHSDRKQAIDSLRC